MGFFDFLRTPQQILENKLKKAVGKKGYGSFRIIVGNTEYSVTIDNKFLNAISYRNETREEEIQKQVNRRPVLDKDGNHEYHLYTPAHHLPSGGSKLDPNSDWFKPYKIYHYYVDAIPLGIVPILRLNNAPKELIEAIEDDLDNILIKLKNN